MALKSETLTPDTIPTDGSPITLGLFALEELIKQTPAIVADFQQLFSKGIPTADDWAALRAKVMAESYATFVPDSALTPTPPAPAPVVALPAAMPAVSASSDPLVTTFTPVPAATPDPALATVNQVATPKPALTYEALIVQSKAQVDGEPYAGTVMARLLALEQVISKGLGKSLDQILAS